MKSFALLAAVAALSTTSALGADLGVINTTAPSAYMEPAGFNWTGFYVGLNGGYGWADYGGFTQPEGGFGGIQAGYNYDFGGLVLGLEADLQLAALREDIVFGDPGVSGYIGLDYFGTVRARAGLALDRLMPYVTGGLAYSRAAVRVNNNGVELESTDDFVGFAVGGGLEYSVTNNVSVKGEYLYANFGEGNLDGADYDLTAHAVRVGLNYKF
jgi:outer membrane immunogenic protein